jgi:hypothetical protein
MKNTLTTTQAASMLADDEYSSFTRAGAYALVEYLEQIEEECGEEIEFDYVAIRCDWSEYESLQEWGENYFGSWNKLTAQLGENYFGPMDDETPEEYAERFDEAISDYINDHGTLIEFDGGVIVSSF